MEKTGTDTSLKGDLAGGITSSIVALPESMAYGILVFAPLGPDYSYVGILAGLIALCFSNLASAPFGGVRIMQSGPFSLSSMMLASALALILNRVGGGNGGGAEGKVLAVTLLFLVVFLSGALQVLFGVLKLGDLTKYIPYPVTAGLMNGTAILIFLGQVRPMLGLSAEASYLDVAALRSQTQLLTLFVSLVTLAAIWQGPRITKKIPPLFVGLIIGTAVYYVCFFILKLLGAGDALGPVVGAIPAGIPKPEYAWKFAALLTSRETFQSAMDVAPMAVGIAIVVSLQSLIASVSADSLTQERSNTNRELIGQGMGNMLSGAFGGIASAGSQSRTIANYNFGGKTSVSRVATGLFALAVLVLLSPLVARLPKVVLAATLVALAARAFNAWSLNLGSRFFNKIGRRKDMVADLAVIAMVAAILVVIGIFEAVGAGILISVGLFVYRMGREIIRRDYSADAVRSNVHRSEQENGILEHNGRKIRVLELEGSLFFGTTDKLASSVDAIMRQADAVILDLRRVADVDSTGADILVQIKGRCQKYNTSLTLCSMDPRKGYEAFLRSTGALEKFGEENIFESIDDALARAEDDLLDKHLGADRYEKETALSGMDILKEFGEEQLLTFSRYMDKTSYADGEVVIRQGDAADRFFFIAQGRASIFVELPQLGESNRIGTLCPGNIFGEMAIIDGLPRSASVVADGRLTCWRLLKDDLANLNAEQPDIGRHLLTGLCRELSKRIRVINKIVTELKA